MNYIDLECECSASDSDSESVNNSDSSFVNDGEISENTWTSIDSLQSSKNNEEYSSFINIVEISEKTLSSCDSLQTSKISKESIVSDDSYESSFIDDRSNVSILSSERETDDEGADENAQQVRLPYKLQGNIMRKILDSDTVCYF